MKKFLSLLAAIALMCSVVGCSSGGSVTIDHSATDVVNSSDIAEPSSPTDSIPADATHSETLTTAPTTTIAVGTGDVAGDSLSDEYDVPAIDFEWDTTLDDYEITEDGAAVMPSEEWLPPDDIIKPPVIEPEAGLLTGGEWNDNDHWHDWVSLYQTHEDWEQYREFWHIDYTDSRVEVKITADGEPVEGATVHGYYMSSVTDNSGTAYLFFNGEANDSFSGDVVRQLTVEYNGIEETIMDWDLVTDGDEIIYELKADISAPQKSLDLMLMVDTTGSMTDELMYLQEELKDVINRIQLENGNLPIRVSVNFYRDEGDEYIIKDFPFTEDIDSAISDIAAQEASGGGDTPEAVHTALDNALNGHNWNDNSTKLMFFVLDAPPHDDNQIIDETNKLIKQAAEMGVRLIPVASSGIDKSTEYLLRSMAFTTGGTYTFLTDHSGIGGSHIEPTIGNYTVEKLNDMMVRIVNSYLSTISISELPIIAPTEPIIDFDDMLMSIDVNFNDPTHYYLLNVMADGSLYRTTYIGHDSGDFFKKYRACDESAFDIAYTEKADTLDSETIALLTEYISAIDTSSEYYDYTRDNDGITFDVEEPLHVTVYSYHSIDGKVQPFHITSHAGTNIYHETKDESALAAYQLLQEHDLVLDWLRFIQR